MIEIGAVTFDITNRCDFKCKHCYKELNKEPIYLDIDLIKSFLNKLGNKRKLIVISGGEPLLHPKCITLLNAISDEYKVRLNTNGYRLNEHVMQLKKIPNLEIQVSLDGYNRKTYYEIRNNYFFDTVLNNIRMALKENLNVHLCATLTSKTINSYTQFIQLSKKMGAKLIMRPMVNTGTRAQQDLKISYEQLKKWAEEISKKKIYSYTVGQTAISANACPLLMDKPGIGNLTVDNLGNIYPCSFLRGRNFYLGNIADTDGQALENNCQQCITQLNGIFNSRECKMCGFRKKFGNGTCLAACFFSNKECIMDLVK
ncbi:radical SAM protein [Zhenpiania hominis]|uniref:radical SAM protein n=1 Tax=Zhenpiania hominis TaxID=2763644 RepID=UPI0039F46E28